MPHQENTRLSRIAPDFLAYATAELGFAAQTISKYEECLRQVGRVIGDRPVVEYSKQDIQALKASMLGRSLSAGRQIGILAAIKGLLLYCRKELELPVLDAALVTLPKRPRREVAYLTSAEVEKFVSAIDLYNQNGKPFEAGFRFRALVEVLLGSAMRISEVLSLNRGDIDFDTREARIIGKGNKQRTVFFTDRALLWVRKYAALRTDPCPALFATQGGRSRLERTDIWRPFTRYRIKSGIAKRVTPHLLRHYAGFRTIPGELKFGLIGGSWTSIFPA